MRNWQTKQVEFQHWFSRSHPQTLQIAVVLLYLDAAESILALLFNSSGFVTNATMVTSLFLNLPVVHIGLPTSFANPLWVILALVEAGAALALANEKNWGYKLAIAFACLGLVETIRVILAFGVSGGWVILAIFQAALVATLAHPMSRQYRKIWFK